LCFSSSWDKLKSSMNERTTENIQQNRPFFISTALPTALSTTLCPKCGEHYRLDAPECSFCGLVFRKFEEAQVPLMVYGSERLEVAWSHVLENFEDIKSHQAFFKICLEERNLTYGAYRYRRFLEAQPTHTLAQKMRYQFRQAVLTTFLSTSTKTPPVSSRWVEWSLFFLCAGLVGAWCWSF